MKNNSLSSYQRLKNSFIEQREEYQKDIKTLLEASNESELKKVKEKYKFLKNQKVNVLFGKNASKAARSINMFLQKDFE